MKYPLIVFIIFYFFGITARAQTDSLSTKYREDQFYISLAMMLQDQGIAGFKQNGFSNNFQIGFVRDFPLNKNGNIALGLGLGYGFSRLTSNLSLVGVPAVARPIFLVNENEKNRQTFSTISFPIAFRWRTSTHDKTAFWRIYGGLKYNFNFGSQFQSALPEVNDVVDYIRKSNSTLFLSAGYNTWNMYLEYDLNSIYRSTFELADGTTPKLRTLKIGLIFYLL